MARWRQGQILERISDQAIEQCYEQWRVFDVDERELASGMDTGHLVIGE